MKIVLLGPDASRHKGGIAQFISSLARNLQSLGELSFYTWYQQYPEFLISRALDSVPIYRSPKLARGTPILGFLNPISWIRFLSRTIYRQPDLIILNWAHPVHSLHYLLFILFFKIFLNSKIALIVHNVEPHESFPLSQILSRLVFRSVDRIIVHSKEEKLKAMKIPGVKEVQQLFMPLFDFFPENKVNLEAPPNSFLFFGIIRKYKGLEILLKAIAIAKEKRPEILLTVAGEFMFDEDRRQCQEMIDVLKLGNHVSLLDRYIAEEEIPALVSASQALIFPFLSVTQSASLSLAFAYGKPVIASNLPAFCELVKDGFNGSIFDCGDSESLAKAILDFEKIKWNPDNLSAVGASLCWKKYSELLLSGGEISSFGLPYQTQFS